MRLDPTMCVGLLQHEGSLLGFTSKTESCNEAIPLATAASRQGGIVYYPKGTALNACAGVPPWSLGEATRRRAGPR